MSQSMGFNWGFKPSSESPAASAISPCKITKPRVKRRLAPEETASTASTTPTSATNLKPGRLIAKRRTALSGIQGQPLPLARAVELMDKNLLQSTLLELVKLHPEIQSTFMALQPPSRSLDQYVSVLRTKLDQIYHNLPYSRLRGSTVSGEDTEQLNDYAFVRVKSCVMEFLNCLVDCVLESIPPQTHSALHSLKVLDAATELLSQVPNFSTASNNYYKNVCYEQLAEIWCTVIRQVTQDITFTTSPSGIVDWHNILQKHNANSHGKLQKPCQLLQTFQEQLDPSHIQAALSQDQQHSSNLWNNLV
ncbi:LADA_0H07668g1_1 [Lachancea dasiensis]|uniref:Tethering factor for nuclear proteasome STS1 n=1 Tax=Lachancea dasiensis TaxID=1072105 RepID=A0A1G4K282_9SACH|nr:LADA_0H07668g1_1 [Lachancea dasiensis]